MKLSILAGSTSQTINVFIRDSSSTTGAGLTGLVFNSAGLTAYYALPKAAAVQITLATLAAITTAWSSGGLKEVDAANMPGWYRLDLPDAAIASGRFVSLHLKGATNMAPLPIEIELTAWNNQDGVRGGMTALPNAAAGANTGLPVVGTQVPNATAGAANGLLIAGSNAATTFAGLTTGALSCTTITASGAVAFQSTFAVTTSTSLGALSCTTLTASGAVAFQSTLAVTGTTTLAAVTTSGTVTFNAFTVSNATTLTGAVSLGSTLTVTGTTTLAALAMTTLTASGAIAFQSTFAITGTTTLAALTTSGTVTLNALTVTNATTLSGAVSLGSTLSVTGATTLAALSMTTLTASGAVAFQSTFAVTTSTSLGALSCTTLTASGAVAMQSTLTVTGATSFAAVSTSGTVAFNAFTIGGTSMVAQTGNSYVRIGAPVGASISEDIAAVQADTDNIQTRLPAALTADGNIKADALKANGAAIPTNFAVLGIAASGKISGVVLADTVTALTSLTLTQAIPTSNTANTLGDCLNAARAQGFGKWGIVGTTLTLYAPDGTTAVRTFTLDSASAPTSRT